MPKLLDGLRIGIDLDGVIFDYPSALKIAADRIGIPCAGTESPITYGMVEPSWFSSTRDWRTVHEEFSRVDQRTCPLLDQTAARSLAQLREAGAQVGVTTARKGIGTVTDEQVQDDTRAALAANGFEFDFYVFDEDKANAQCHIHVDDSPSVISALVEAGRYVAVYNQPYNRQVFAHMRVAAIKELANDILSDPDWYMETVR